MLLRLRLLYYLLPDLLLHFRILLRLLLLLLLLHLLLAEYLLQIDSTWNLKVKIHVHILLKKIVVYVDLIHRI